MKRVARLVSLVAAVVACGADSSPSPIGSEPAEEGWVDFYQIQVQAPADSWTERQDSVLPGPGGLGGSPTGERPSIRLIRGGPHSFYVVITRVAGRPTLESTESVLRSNGVGTNIHGEATDVGWDIHYEGTNTLPSGAPRQRSHIVYAELAGANFECSYAEENCADPAAAEAVCRSMRPKPTP